VEGGTFIGIVVAGTAIVLVGAGALLGRSGSGRSGVITYSLAAALIAAVCGVVIVAAGTEVYLSATVPDCSTSESTPTPPATNCLDGGDGGKKAAATGLLGGLVAGVIGGVVTAYRRSRSLRTVAGGVLAVLGASVLTIESMIVLVLWSG
jgi:disulfide bond formation protein DsbB